MPVRNVDPTLDMTTTHKFPLQGETLKITSLKNPPVQNKKSSAALKKSPPKFGIVDGFNLRDSRPEVVITSKPAGITSKPAFEATEYVHEVTIDSIEDNENNEIVFDPADQPLSMPYAKG